MKTNIFLLLFVLTLLVMFFITGGYDSAKEVHPLFGYAMLSLLLVPIGSLIYWIVKKIK